MDAINDFSLAFSSFLWGWPMIILLLGTHIFLTVRLRFPQRKILKAIKLPSRRIRTQQETYHSLVPWLQRLLLLSEQVISSVLPRPLRWVVRVLYYGAGLQVYLVYPQNMQKDYLQ